MAQEVEYLDGNSSNTWASSLIAFYIGVVIHVLPEVLYLADLHLVLQYYRSFLLLPLNMR